MFASIPFENCRCIAYRRVASREGEGAGTGWGPTMPLEKIVLTSDFQSIPPKGNYNFIVFPLWQHYDVNNIQSSVTI